MSTPFSTSSVVLVALLAVALPIILRIVSSPFTLLLISPFVISLFALTFFVLTVLLGHSIDTRRPISRSRLSHASQPFSFSTPAAWQAVLTRSHWSQSTPLALPPLCPETPEVSAALDEILSLIVRDFVVTWYKDISSSPSFPAAVSTLLHDSLSQILDRAADIDLSALVVKRILPKVTSHIDLFRHSEIALRGAGLERQLTQSEELDLLLANKYATRGNGKLHPAVDNLSTTFTRQAEEAHIRQLVDSVLPYVLPEKESKSGALKIVAREIVACAVLFPVMEMISDPDFWNKAIDEVAGAAIHQQKLITKVRNVLESQLPRSHQRIPTATSTLPASTETITIRTDLRQFESFLRSINRCSSLLDARRLKNDVVTEIRRTRMLLANHEKDDWINGERTEDVVAFLDRLYTAKRKVEARITILGGTDEPRQSTYQETSGPRAGPTLRDVLQNPSSLSYFMEFMDRQHHSLLVQFWLTVESFKNPLENVDSNSSDDDDDPIQDPSALIAAKEDISMIYELYFSGPVRHPLLSSIPKKHVDSICAFAQNPDTPSPSAQRKVRRSVMLSQRQVERDMEQDFEEFERSELWFRAITDTDFGAKTTKPSAYPALSNTELHSLPRPPTPPAGSSRPGLGHPSHLPRTASGSGVAMHRTASAGSNRSSQSFTALTRSSPTNIEVLMSPISDLSSEPSRAPLFDDPEDHLQRQEEQRMEAIHAALTDIMATEANRGGRPPLGEESSDSVKRLSNIKPLKGQGPRKKVFDDDADFEGDNLDAVELEDPNDEHGSYQLAAPGDLQLSYEIARLSDNISNLQAQSLMLDSLIKKAELTGDTQELRLLSKSKSAMNRELRELNFQKLQYEQQESANRLFSDRTKVSIVSSTVAEEDGKSVVRYLIEVQQLAVDGSFASGWVVARRYNEFLNMHNKLRERYALVRNLDFPGKRLVTALSGSFVDTRKTALEKYLQNVILIPVVCESDDLRAFLSRDSPFVAHESSSQPAAKGSTPFSKSGLVRTVYKSVTDSIDDMFFGPSMLDVMIQRLTRQAAEFAGIVGSGVNDEDLVAQALNAGKSAPEATLMQLSGDLKPLEGETSTSTFSAPICDLILAVFELDKKNNWLRRQAIVIILQQVLGGTIERKIRENTKTMLNESRILSFIGLFRNGLWPDGKLKPPTPPRTPDERRRTRDEANRKLSSLFPDLAANMIGRSNARRGARRIFAVLQNRRLNQHIAYTIVDEVVAALFPELNAKT